MIKTIYTIACFLIVPICLWGQTVNVSYLNPTHGNGNPYKFVRFGTASDYQAGFMWNNTSTDYGDGNDFSIFTYGNRDISFRTGTGNFIVFPSSGGNVGIGTKNPISKLQVNGDFFLSGTESVNGWGITRFFWKGHSLVMGSAKGRYAHNTIELKPGGSTRGELISTLQLFQALGEDNHEERVKITSSKSHPTYFNGGNVGIGTKNPISKLQVNGDFFLSGTESVNGWGITRFFWKGHSLVMGSAKGRYSHNTIELKPGGSSRGELISTLQLFQALGEDNHEERVKITSSKSYPTYFNGGNVGIGTTTPDSKLTVKGKIHAEEVKIDLSVPAPDYVFKKDYDLLTIDEVQQHIQEKGHLPNIPSAKVMETEGVDLGTMNMKLLEKIEELTLYTIEQENRIKELESQNSRIKIVEEKLELLLKNK